MGLGVAAFEAVPIVQSTRGALATVLTAAILFPANALAVQAEFWCRAVIARRQWTSWRAGLANIAAASAGLLGAAAVGLFLFWFLRRV
jgi:hypothetical protein